MPCTECGKTTKTSSKFCSNACAQRSCRRKKAEKKLCRNCSKKVKNGSLCNKCLKSHREWNKDCFSKNYRKRPRYSNLASKMITSAKVRARKKRVEFSISREDIIIPDVCPVLGIPMSQNVGVVKDNSPTLDRVDNSMGYIPSNVMVISYRANCLKRDSSVQELIKLVEYVVSHRSNKKVKVILEDGDANV